MMLNPFKTPKLAEFLNAYGFETAEDLVIDKMSRVFGGDYLIPVITTYINFPITKDFNLASFFPQSRSVKATTKPNPEIIIQELALTSPMSWTINEAQFNSGNANFDENTGIKGPISVMGVATVNVEGKPKPDEPTKSANSIDITSKKARILVTGSSCLLQTNSCKQFRPIKNFSSIVFLG